MNPKDTVFYPKTTLNIKGKILDLSSPVVMGILNVTPDSFYDGGVYTTEKDILNKASKILSEGARIIDVGGYSSRSGADDITTIEEIQRVVPAIRAIIHEFPNAIISIDTFRAEVARAAIEEGAAIINDISGGALDKEMFATVAQLKAPYILMHMKGTPQTMANENDYNDLLLDIIDYFQKKISELKNLGIKDLVIDPGFGFAKSINQNYELLRNLNYFKLLNLPILVGISRKSMIYRKLSIGSEEALNGTTVLNTIALMNGATILRVHDVKEAVEAITLFKATYP